MLVFMTLLEILPHTVTSPRYISSTLAELSNGLIENSNKKYGNGKYGNGNIYTKDGKQSNETLKAALESLIVYAAEYNQEDQVADLIAAMMKEVNSGPDKIEEEKFKSEIEKDVVKEILKDEELQNLEDENRRKVDDILATSSNSDSVNTLHSESPKLSDLSMISQGDNSATLDSLRRQKMEEEDETEDDNSMIGLPNFDKQFNADLPNSSSIQNKVDSLLNNAMTGMRVEQQQTNQMSTNDYRNMRRQEVKDRLAAGKIVVNDMPQGGSSQGDSLQGTSTYSYSDQSQSSQSASGEIRYKNDPSSYNINFHSGAGENINNQNDPHHKHNMAEQFLPNPGQESLGGINSGGDSSGDTMDPSKLSTEQSKIFLSKVSKVLEKKHMLVNDPRIQQAQKETDDYYYPKMIMVGVKKCGTGALARFLGMHPLVKYAGEQYYFNRYYTNSLQWYLHQMPRSRPSEIVFEKTPSYLFSPSVAENIKKFDPNIKIINIMCDPARRIYSDFLHMNRFDKDKATMENFQSNLLEGLSSIQRKQDQIDNGYTTWDEIWHQEDFKFATRGASSFGKVILRSCYSIFLKKWYQLFGQNQNMINIDGSRLYTDPGAVLVEIQKFLNVPVALDENNFYFDEDRGLFCSIDFNGKPKCAGKGKGRSVKSEVPVELKQKMRDLLRPFNEELERIEGKQFNDWDW